jgi:GLPGLI family protein
MIKQKPHQIYFLIVITIAFIIPVFRIKAQEGMIGYRQIWSPAIPLPSGNKAGIVSFLYFKNDQSLYVYNRNKDVEQGKKPSDLLEQGFSQVEFEQTDSLGNMFYKDFNSGKLMIRQLVCGNAYLTIEPLPLIDWRIVSGEKHIGNFNCKRAVTTFRGRNYEAWFTPEIPLKNGPWKFYGLPGLILEVYDKGKEVWFSAESVIIPYDTRKDLLLPEKGKYIPFSEFKHVEYRDTQKLIDSLRTAFNLRGDNQIIFNYSPIEKSYD